ncbi:MAG: hypothetical protein ACI9HK_005131 [Pirellulaceae bacterium]|jgi:hypothetical protein
MTIIVACLNQIIASLGLILLDRHGEQAVQVFDQRLGGDVKDSIGNGLTSYAVKELVRKIKVTAREFAADDPEFLEMVEKAFQDEARTVAGNKTLPMI